MAIFEDAKDLHIKSVVVFGNSTDNKIYKEAEFTNQVTESEMNELFKKGLLLICTAERVFEVPVKVNAEKIYTVGASSLTEWSALANA